jgi:hypothetical protein
MQLFRHCRVIDHIFMKRIPAVSNGNIRVGITTPADKSNRQALKQHALRQLDDIPLRIGDREMLSAKSNPAECDHGAMSQQGIGGAPGNQSFPQKLVQLVGYRDPSACNDPFLRPHLVQATRRKK